ncbi:phosphoribosylformylglycinamidine synthase subunit PurL [Sulfobacillus harzensis]|uniref:Phosphoribosylformylglycinamidine synthase subunit PurL n=1 Tax=Sulfobacillus harzensis TaxID=2729629 RepID=A0A7Y0Q559_9FIRM|nr:phosphoribosylformylglycinamidine synthase subunit PurL [Sulfobacillus harzensis]NMP23929.1 phosphoribosylformylglycinamidine synthase subunit PurL [Sulfobacillus harzensis]
MQASDVGLTAEEYARITELMGREPNDLELGLFGALWSEHCSYKNSKALLSRLPHDGPYVVAGPGGNAGVVRLGDALEVAFKVESHNHPSYVEPVQGAATGVGGILRDIIAMGARPILVGDALRFGTDRHSIAILSSVVKGVGQYSNAIGVPTVTGDIGFSPTYRTNPLVNVLALGIRTPGQAMGAHTASPGQLVVLMGQRTGRDGIHGASLLASRDFDQSSQELRPTVQVGDPFLGKLLMEATLKTVSEGLLNALQDLGAAGLTSAVAELCAGSHVGAEIYLDRVPLREPGLSPYEIMLSETQERMLLIVSESNLKAVLDIAADFEILATVIGHTTDSGDLVLQFGQDPVARLKTTWLVDDAPRRAVDDSWWQALDERIEKPVPPAPAFQPKLLLEVASSLDGRDRSPVYRQYDWMIQTRTVRGPGHDAAVLDLGDHAGLAVSIAGPGRWAAVDPYAGGAGAVWRALAGLAAQGAEPLGLTDGVNAGNPDKPESYRAMGALIRGVADAARAAGVPVTGGNVSLHNETDGESIWPTVVIGAAGSHPHAPKPVGDGLGVLGDAIYLLNPAPLHWGGSVAALLHHGPSPYPRIVAAEGGRVLRQVADWVRERPPRALTVVGDGGLGLTLIRMWARSGPSLGIEIQLAETDTKDKTLRFFSEGPLQWVAVVASGDQQATEAAWLDRNIPFQRLGTVKEGPMMVVDGRYQWSYGDVMRAWRQPYKEVDDEL